MSSLVLRRSTGLGAMLVAAVLIVALAAGNSSLARRADGNIGVEGSHSGFSDSILVTPNPRTSVPRDNIFAIAPGAARAAPMPQSKKDGGRNAAFMNRISPEEHH